MNKAQNRPTLHKVLSMILALVMVLSLLPMSGFTAYDAQTTAESSSESTEFMRIFHLDCGRKYFTVAQIEELIDTAAENNYTHVELAFGNDGLRFLLDNMELTVGDTTYNSNDVTNAIKKGNKAYDSSASYSPSVDELSQDEMDAIITYANNKGIGIIPMFDAPGHLYAVIEAMKELGLNVTSYQATTSGASANMAIDPTDTDSLDFVLALMQKYITYFAGKGCGYFNIAADECGFTNFNNANRNMTTAEYTAYATFVNSMAAAVKEAPMIPMAFNDGFYHVGLTLNYGVTFDTGIYICYWDASTGRYAPASELAEKGFKIINTHNKWYYVVGTSSNDWYGDEWSKKNMQGTNGNNSAPKCNVTDGDYTTTTGCMNAVWCDNPSVEYSTYASTIKDHIVTLANVEYNKSFFVASSTDVDPVEPSTTPDTDIDTEELPKETITVTVNESGDVVIDGSHVGTEGGLITIDEYASYKITHNTTQTGGTATKATSLSTGEYIIGNNSQWLVLNGSTVDKTTDSSAATKWTITKSGSSYTIKSGSYYLYGSSSGVSASTSSFNWSWSSDNGFYFQTTSKSKTTTYYLYYSSNSTEWKVSDRSKNKGGANPYILAGGTDVLSTTITFNGLKVGESKYVTIGDKQYNVNVIAEDLSKAATLPIQLWFTNSAIETEEGKQTSSAFSQGSNWLGTQKPYYVSIDARNAYGENGVALASVIPNNLLRYEESIVYWIDAKTGKAQKELVLLSGRVHSSSDGNIQKIFSTDYSNSGTEFTYVRYWGGQWAVTSTPDVADSWTPITDTSATTKSPTSSGVQLAAYYMMRSEITKEVTTDVSDWGFVNGDSDYSTQISKGNYVMLDFAVKYEDGTQNPSTFPQSGKTFVFHCNSYDTNGAVGSDSSNNYYRKLNNFRGVNTSNYEIYMVTVTMTSASASKTISSTSSYSYDKTTEQIVWAIDEDAKTNSGLDEYTSISGSSSVYSGCKIGGDPYVRGVEVYDKHGALITYYVRAKVTEDSLTVHYINKDSNEEFYYYNIAVNSGTYFKSGIALPDTAKGYLKNSEVINIKNVEQKIPTNLQEMPLIPASYRYAIYKCVEVNQDEGSECKNVYLYYTFSNSKSFVVDFGLPLNIPLDRLSTDLSGATINSVTVSGAKYGTTDYSNRVITYTPTKAINGSEVLTVAINGTLNYKDADGNEQTTTGTVTYFVTIIPASTVYYEDGFANFNSGKYTADSKETEVAWNIEGSTETNVTQALEALGDKKNVYGYDEAYDNSTLYSLGSAHKVTVSADMAKDTSVVWPSATFTFKGTGFDIISLTDNTSGIISVKVYKLNDDGTETQVKGTLVNNYYGYKYENGQWVVYKEAGANPLYQIPVIKISGLDYATYRVDIKVSYASYGDMDQDGSYTFVLDAIRVYDPMGKDYDYSTDVEKSPSYVEIRKVILDTANLDDDSIESTGVVFIDGKTENVVASDYANYGPNHEAYLANSQAIAFWLVASAQPTSVQLGAKLANGTAGSLTIGGASCVKASNGVLSLNTSTDMYYELTDLGWSEQDDGTYKSNVITLINNGKEGSIISLTNLKFIGATYVDTTAEVQAASEGVALLSLAASPAMVNEAVLAVSNVLYVDPEPTPDPEPSPDPEPTPDPEPEVKTFEPETFKVSLNKDSIREGQKATLTVKASAEVEAITVNGETYDEYQTRLERSGWKWWSADRTEYHVFTVTLTPTETTDYEVIAVDAEGAVSEAETVTLTVKAAQSNWWEDMWNNFFGKWF